MISSDFKIDISFWKTEEERSPGPFPLIADLDKDSSQWCINLWDNLKNEIATQKLLIWWHSTDITQVKYILQSLS